MRSTQRRRREKNAVSVVALVGYTNAGKSTVLNRLTRSDIPANNRLFDTLDTTTRRLWLGQLGREVLLSDTVGFIRKLPTHLVEAFKATLEELQYADPAAACHRRVRPGLGGAGPGNGQPDPGAGCGADAGAAGVQQVRRHPRDDGAAPGAGMACAYPPRTGEGMELLLQRITEALL